MEKRCILCGGTFTCNGNRKLIRPCEELLCTCPTCTVICFLDEYDVDMKYLRAELEQCFSIKEQEADNFITLLTVCREREVY